MKSIFARSRLARSASLPKITAAFFLLLSAILPRAGRAQESLPILEYPQKDLDDTSAYRGYQTRFFRDSEGNAVQVVINHLNGRLVNLWADGADESLSFTARDSSGGAAALSWLSAGATPSRRGNRRFLQYDVVSEASRVDVGLFLLASMRKERDFQYMHKEILPFDSSPYIEDPLPHLVDNLARLSVGERDRQLLILHAPSLDALRTRFTPRIALSVVSGRWLLSLAQPSFDGRNLLTLELSGDTAVSAAEIAGGSVSIRSRSGRPLALRLHIGTDSPPLTPLRRDKIFNDEFLRFIRRIDAERDSLDRQTGGRINPELQNRYMLRSEHLERQLRSVELLSYKEKLMAGLPNYATYFGRDMMMSVLMMESILRPSVCAYVIESVLKKLSPEGKVSHEEALGGQAVRENAEEYSRTIEEYFRRIGPADAAVAESLLIHARALLGNLQRVRENYRMVDEDFQLSVLVDRFLSAPGIAAQEKRSFLFGQIDGRANLALILRNMLFVYRQAALFGLRQDATSLVSFHRDDDHGWISGSWRDSGAGYGGGRFAMDVNAIWVPEALKAMQDFFATLRTLGITRAKVDSLCPEVRSTPLERCCEDPSAFSPLIKAWGKAAQLFTVTIAPSDVRKRVQGKLSSLADDERRYWDSVLTHTKVPKEGVTFYALSLDSSGRPIPVVNSDPATALFLGDYSGGQRLLPGSPDVVKECVNPFVTPYPVGLFVAGIGPVIANDAYAKSDVWDGFRREEYHSPRVIWGREVNLFQLGMCRLIRSALSAKNAPLVRGLRESLKLVHDAVEASGLKHSELWSYRIDRGSVVPARYAESCDIQLWNLTDLAVQFELDRLPR